MEFSPDGKYIAFSEQIFHSGGSWVSFSTPLYMVNLTNLNLVKLEDEAHYPSWNPRQRQGVVISDLQSNSKY